MRPWASVAAALIIALALAAMLVVSRHPTSREAPRRFLGLDEPFESSAGRR